MSIVNDCDHEACNFDYALEIDDQGLLTGRTQTTCRDCGEVVRHYDGTGADGKRLKLGAPS